MPNMSRRTIHSLDTVSSSYTTNVVHKTTNTDATAVGYSNKYYDTVDSNIRPRKLFSDAEDEEETTVTRTRQTIVRRWTRIKRTFYQFLRTVTSVFLYLTFVQTYFFSKLHHFSSRLMLVDTWLLKKRTKGTDKIAMVMLLCLLPLLLFGGKCFLKFSSSHTCFAEFFVQVCSLSGVYILLANGISLAPSCHPNCGRLAATYFESFTNLFSTIFYKWSGLFSNIYSFRSLEYSKTDFLHFVVTTKVYLDI